MIHVNPKESFKVLINRIFTTISLPEAASSFHLYGLDSNFKVFPDDSLCATVFFRSYRRFVVHPHKTRSVQVYFEGRRAEIDLPIGSLISNLIFLAIECFSLTISSEGAQYQMLDSTRRVICKIDDDIPSGVLVLKRSNPFCSDIVFNCRINDDILNTGLSVVSKLILSSSMISLLSALRNRRDLTMELVELPTARLKEIMPLYAKGEVGELASSELTSLLFLLCDSGPEPLMSPELHRFSLAVLAEPLDAVKCSRLLGFVMSLPLETHIVIGEIVLLFGRLVGESRERLVHVLAEVFFPGSNTVEKDRLFMSLLLMCGPELFAFPMRPERMLRLFGERVVLFEENVVRNYEEVINVEMSETVEFEFPKILEPHWLVISQGSTVNLKRLSKMLEMIMKLKFAVPKLGNDVIIDLHDRATDFEFDSLFGSQ
jgi:hypothetical protein